MGSLGFEAAMDYQSSTNESETARVRNTPIQVSALLLPIKKSFAPYALAGLGWYRHKIEALDGGRTVATANATDFGYHAGAGLQLKFGQHAAIFADYRYVWVDANGLDGFSEPHQVGRVADLGGRPGVGGDRRRPMRTPTASAAAARCGWAG